MHLPTAGWGAPKPRVAVEVLNPGAPNAPVPSVPPSLGWVLPNNEVCPALRARRRGEKGGGREGGRERHTHTIVCEKPSQATRDNKCIHAFSRQPRKGEHHFKCCSTGKSPPFSTTLGPPICQFLLCTWNTTHMCFKS